MMVGKLPAFENILVYYVINYGHVIQRLTVILHGG